MFSGYFLFFDFKASKLIQFFQGNEASKLSNLRKHYSAKIVGKFFCKKEGGMGKLTFSVAEIENIDYE